MTFLEAAYEILKKQGCPMGIGEITRLAIESQLIDTHGKTPASTMGGALYKASNQMCPKRFSSTFVHVKRRYWGLMEWEH